MNAFEVMQYMQSHAVGNVAVFGVDRENENILAFGTVSDEVKTRLGTIAYDDADARYIVTTWPIANKIRRFKTMCDVAWFVWNFIRTGEWTVAPLNEFPQSPALTLDFFAADHKPTLEEWKLLKNFGQWRLVPRTTATYWTGFEKNQFTMLMRDGVGHEIAHYTFDSVEEFKSNRGAGWAANAQYFRLGKDGVTADPTAALLYILKLKEREAAMW